jgi:hypothetical protein
MPRKFDLSVGTIVAQKGGQRIIHAKLQVEHTETSPRFATIIEYSLFFCLDFHDPIERSICFFFLLIHWVIPAFPSSI